MMHEHEVERTLRVQGTPGRVWDAVVCGDWLGEDGLIEPRPGADGWVRDAGVLRHVVVETVEPGRRLVFRWWPLGADGVGPSSRVSIDVEDESDEDVPEQTRVVVVEAPVVAGGMIPDAGPMAMALH